MADKSKWLVANPETGLKIYMDWDSGHNFGHNRVPIFMKFDEERKPWEFYAAHYCRWEGELREPKFILSGDFFDVQQSRHNGQFYEHVGGPAFRVEIPDPERYALPDMEREWWDGPLGANTDYWVADDNIPIACPIDAGEPLEYNLMEPRHVEYPLVCIPYNQVIHSEDKKRVVGTERRWRIVRRRNIRKLTTEELKFNPLLFLEECSQGLSRWCSACNDMIDITDVICQHMYTSYYKDDIAGAGCDDFSPSDKAKIGLYLVLQAVGSEGLKQALLNGGLTYQCGQFYGCLHPADKEQERIVCPIFRCYDSQIKWPDEWSNDDNSYVEDFRMYLTTLDGPKTRYANRLLLDWIFEWEQMGGKRWTRFWET